ncbi:hypothetical protein NDU88_010965 [Pleurodeles waltl]|uniref:Uncharacterized protein n=1 Tax=Pleurodeles waltl TaxID=8319 RepID=A0AAV7S2Q7_PLEWA|nr:hypothetical protein NDU88_010965 [Pleurodeles waltl]
MTSCRAGCYNRFFEPVHPVKLLDAVGIYGALSDVLVFEETGASRLIYIFIVVALAVKLLPFLFGLGFLADEKRTSRPGTLSNRNCSGVEKRARPTWCATLPRISQAPYLKPRGRELSVIIKEATSRKWLLSTVKDVGGMHAARPNCETAISETKLELSKMRCGLEKLTHVVTGMLLQNGHKSHVAKPSCAHFSVRGYKRINKVSRSRHR